MKRMLIVLTIVGYILLGVYIWESHVHTNRLRKNVNQYRLAYKTQKTDTLTALQLYTTLSKINRTTERERDAYKMLAEEAILKYEKSIGNQRGFYRMPNASKQGKITL